MKNVLGNNVTLEIFGESHGPFVGASISGLPSGIKIDHSYINKEMKKRKPHGNISTARVEEDQFMIISGVFNGFTTGAPLTVVIENKNIKSKDYDNLKDIVRPGHADYTAFKKYFGYHDYRGGGHFSGRLTAGIVAIGAICKKALEDKGIIISSHIKQIAHLQDKSFDENISWQIKQLNDSNFAVIDEEIKNQMIKLIEDTKKENDSLGGIVESVILNLPAGLGEPAFDSFEGMIARALFSIGAIKGVEFGEGFNFANLKGSKANDAFTIKNSQITTSTNHNGGINGGISNGMPIIIKTAVKPTSSISKIQKSVNIKTYEETDILIEGRHDPCIVHRVISVIDNMLAIVIMDLLVTREGQKW